MYAFSRLAVSTTNQVHNTKYSYTHKEVTLAGQSCCEKLKWLYHLWLHKRSVSNENCWVFLGSLPFLIVFGHVGYTAITQPDLTWKRAAGWRLWGVQKHGVGVFFVSSLRPAEQYDPATFERKRKAFFWRKSIILSNVKWVTGEVFQLRREQSLNVIFMLCQGYLNTTIQLSHQSWDMDVEIAES